MLAYLARCTHRVVIANQRLISVDDIPACSRIVAKVGLAMPALRSFAPTDRDITFTWKDDRAERAERYKTSRVRSLTSFSRSRRGRLAASSSMLGIELHHGC